MRVLHVITSLKTGGAERLMVDLLPKLEHEGSHVVELLLFDGRKTPFYHEIEGKGIKVHTLSVGGNVYNPLFIVKLQSIVKQYDIIHTHNTACQLFVPIAASLARGKATLVTTEHNSTNRRRNKWWFKPLDQWMYNRYAAIICIADKTRDNLAKYLGNHTRLHTIYNGIDTHLFYHPICDISKKSQYVITMVSAFREQKDQDTLIRAMTHLPENYSLQLVGGGNDQRVTQLKRLCQDLSIDDRVDFLGIRQDVSGILGQSDIVVLSSHWEGLSLSSIEGMASGRPFIASDVDGLHEIVDGAGILFPEGNDCELARVIQNLCENPQLYQHVAQQCQERARQYDISVMAEKYLELYDNLISKSE